MFVYEGGYVNMLVSWEEGMFVHVCVCECAHEFLSVYVYTSTREELAREWVLSPWPFVRVIRRFLR